MPVRSSGLPSAVTQPAGAPSGADPLIPPLDLLLRFERNGSVEGFKSMGQGILRAYLEPQGRLEPHHKVLDIGFGVGKAAWALSKYLNAAGGFCGFEIQDYLVDWCKEHYASHPNFRFDLAKVRSDLYNEAGAVPADQYRFPYDDAEFDLAWAGSLFTHLGPPEAAKYLRETARVLKPGGRIVFTCALINEHNLGLPSKAAERQREYVRASPSHFVLDPATPSRAVAYEENSMRQMVGKAGLIVSTILFGRWANGQAVVPGFQDCIIALKPRPE